MNVELLVDLTKLHWSFFASSERILLIPVLVAIVVYCYDVWLRPIVMEDIDEEELYWLWYVSELLESCETQFDNESQEELVDDKLTIFESCDTVRYWDVDWWVIFSDEIIMISDFKSGIVIVLSPS